MTAPIKVYDLEGDVIRLEREIARLTADVDELQSVRDENKGLRTALRMLAASALANLSEVDVTRVLEART